MTPDCLPVTFTSTELTWNSCGSDRAAGQQFGGARTTHQAVVLAPPSREPPSHQPRETPGGLQVYGANQRTRGPGKGAHRASAVTRGPPTGDHSGTAQGSVRPACMAQSSTWCRGNQLGQAPLGVRMVCANLPVSAERQRGAVDDGVEDSAPERSAPRSQRAPTRSSDFANATESSASAADACVIM
jgi:hypothetical protein